jgi:hypothetical protein
VGVVEVDKEMLSFVDAVYHEQYSLIAHNCIHKSIKIQKKAQETGKQADLIACISVVRMKILRNLPVVSPHMYAIIDGEKVDVSLDPGHEARYCLNSAKRLLFPVNISRIGRRIRKLAGSRLSQGNLNSDG